MTDRMPCSASILKLRSRMLQSIRRYFVDHDFIEVETPVRIPAPALELHIDAEPATNWYLRTSPELHMKRLLAAGHERIFQIGPCFRRGERGRFHSPEYTMLEWYRTQADYVDVLADTKSLLHAVFEDTLSKTTFMFHGNTIELMPLWECVTVKDAFTLAAGWDPVANPDPDRFDMDLVEKVEPLLPVDHPVILKDYPAHAAALARYKPGNPAVAERWELYIGRIELANAFSELTDAMEQRRRFQECAASRHETGADVYPIDESFLTALSTGMPPCAGVALGIDRLMMLLTDSDTIDDVRSFCC